MNRLLYRLGGGAAARPWRTIGLWLVVLVASLGLAGALGGDLHDNYNIPGTSSQAGTDLLRERFPAQSGDDARVVLHDRDGALDPAVVAAVRERLLALPHVSDVGAPVLSGDRDTALLAVRYDVPVTYFADTEGVDALESATEPARDAGVQAELGGLVPENISRPSQTAEAVGFAAALIILVFAFGSIIAAGVPLAVAAIGLGVGTAGVGLLAAVSDVSTTAPTVASMVGIGVGIDYALLLVTRHAEGLRRGLGTRAAAAEATATAGTSVVFAGSTVLVSLLGLKFAGLPTYSSFGYATALVVLAVMLTSVTLVPALCGLAGPRLLGRRSRRERRLADGPASVTDGRTARWAARVGARPLPYALAALVVLLTLAAPMLAMRTWPQDAGTQPTSNTTRQAYDLVAAEYGPGANAPMLVALDLRTLPADRVQPLAASLTSLDGVAQVSPAQFNEARDAAIFTVVPTTGPSDEATVDLLARVREIVSPTGGHVTGTTAVFADISDRLATRLWVVIGFVVAVSLVLLTAVFRSPVVAVKAAVMNLLSVAAAYGVMVAVFQWGWGAELLGLPHATPVSSWVPILMFAVLFGLSMDYEVFLLARVREDWLATGDAHGSVVRGLAGTGRVISTAAAIMIAVFVGFALDPDVTVKMLGLGMGVAVLLDATVTRLVLVPATMALLGRRNWWIPAWLDRLLPHLDVEPAHSRTPDREPELV